MKNKIAAYLLVFLAAASIIIFVAVFFYKNAQKNQANQKAVETDQLVQDAKVGANGSNDKLLPPEIIAIKDNNLIGTIQKIEAKNLQIKSDTNGDVNKEIKNFNITANTFVVSTANSKIEQKAISDLKVGMSVYLQYEKDTNNALTITIQ